MNKMMIAAVIAGGLMLMNSPEAAAHKKEVRNVHWVPAYVHIELRRSERMPRWLKRNKAFRHWYANTSLRRDRRIAWDQLYDIYRWEARWGRSHYRSDNYWQDYYGHRYGERYYDRDDRHPRRHDDDRRRGRH